MNQEQDQNKNNKVSGKTWLELVGGLSKDTFGWIYKVFFKDLFPLPTASGLAKFIIYLIVGALVVFGLFLVFNWSTG